LVATVKIYEMTASQTGYDKTSGTVRFKSANATTVDTNDPITIPSGATDARSFTKTLRLYVATAPDTYIDNLRMYTDGTNSFGTGINVEASNTGTTFVTATRSAIASANDLFGFTSGAPFDLDAVHATKVTGTGFCGDLAVLQMVVASSASPGTLSAETLTIAYVFAPICGNIYRKLREFSENLLDFVKTTLIQALVETLWKEQRLGREANLRFGVCW